MIGWLTFLILYISYVFDENGKEHPQYKTKYAGGYNIQ